jgi:hypothetical protein
VVNITHCPTINKTKDRYIVNKRRKLKPKERKDMLLTEWNCKLCSKQSTCKELCPPMEWIVQQVEVEPGKETPQSNPTFEHTSQVWPEMLGTPEIIFSLFFIDRLDPPEIAKQLQISTRYVYKQIEKSKKTLRQNLLKTVQLRS